MFAALDAFQVGPYLVQNCKSNSRNIATLLKAFRAVLRPVIADLGSSKASDAYATFFKDVSYAPYVRDILRNLTVGASVPPSPLEDSTPPILVCIDGRDQVTYNEISGPADAYDRCQSDVEVGGFALLPTQYILICPKFFIHPAIPARSTTSCYTLDSNPKYFSQDGRSLTRYQIWALMHELVHYYIWTSKQKDLDIYNIDRCLMLPGSSAVLNPQNYIFYAASKWQTQLVLFWFC